MREVVRIYCPSSPHVRAVVAHLLKDEVVARGAGVNPQHFQLIVREGRTIGIDLGAVGGVLRLLPLLARQRTVSEPNVTECLLHPADSLRSGVTLSGTRDQPNEDLSDRL